MAVGIYKKKKSTLVCFFYKKVEAGDWDQLRQTPTKSQLCR